MDPQSIAFDRMNQRRKARHIKGTPEYMAKEPLEQLMQTQKDDLLSLGIVLLDLNDGNIPWMSETDNIDDVYKRMKIVLQGWQKYPLRVSSSFFHIESERNRTELNF